MRYKDHILRAMNTDVEHLNLEENMLMNRTRCLILISLLVGMFAQAQTSSIKGIVTDVKTIPVEYANVILYDAADSTKIVKAATTDVKGRFELSKIPHGSYRLYASCVGYVGTHIRIHNFQEHIKDLPIVLEEQTVALDETTVTAQRVVMEFDRQIIYPGKQEKETAIDGIDLVDKLQLHGIVVGKVEGTISGVLGPIVLTSQIIRVYLSRMIAQFYPDVYVLSFHEITSSVQIQAIGNITLQQQNQPS